MTRSRHLIGRTAVVVGGAQGIGAATAKRLADSGCRVAVMDTAQQPADTLVGMLRRKGAEAIFTHVDVCDREAVTTAFRSVPAHWEAPSLLVHCAAGFVFEGANASLEDWHDVMDPTIAGLSFVVSAFLDRLPKHDADASIVTISSISAHIAQPGYLTYNTSKAAVLGFTRCLALDVASRGVRVNSVSPGTVWTANNERFYRVDLGLDRKEAEASDEHGGKFLLKRFADPDEVAGPIVFLLSPDASFITGTDLVIDGGYLAV